MKWIAPELPEVPENYLNQLGISRFVGEILFRRGYTTVEDARSFLFEDAYTPTPAAEIPGLAEGAACVGSAIHNQKKIGIWGDFDVDGQTSTALLVSAFEQLGGDVVFHIPVRATESHGINIPNLKKMLEQGVELLVTCDTGISELEAIDYAKTQGIQVVVTDHHDIPSTLPDADVIMNPSMLDDSHPLFTLPGVGVAYKFVEQLFFDWGIEEEAAQYLDLVALGIVADVAAITGDTRYLLQRGIRALHTTDRLGLNILMERAGVEKQIVNEEDIGFSLAPRLNALGRLGDANIIVEFLTTRDESRARVIAEQLEGLNAERKLLTSQVYQAAEDQIYADPSINKASVLVLEGKEWPAGVVGIVASRIVEKYGKPAVLLTATNDGILRGSARSVEGCDITEAITECADLLERFGGHPMAAGLSMKAENLGAFRRRLDKAVQSQPGLLEGISVRQFDKLVSLSDISMVLLDDLRVLAPFGHGNPPVIFAAKKLRIANNTSLGRTGEHLRLIVEDGNGDQNSVLWWRGGGESLPSSLFNMVFQLKENHFQGNESVQIEFVDFWLDEETEETRDAAQLAVVDLQNTEILSVVSLLGNNPRVAVWGEGIKLDGFELKSRTQLKLTDELAIVTIPPSQQILNSALTNVHPQIVYWIGIDPKLDEMAPFLQRLSGIGKFILKGRAGKTDLASLAGAMAQTEETVRLGLQWLNAKKVFLISIQADGQVMIATPQNQEEAPLQKIEQALRIQLGEAKAYRKFIQKMNSEEIEVYIRGLIGEYG